MSRTTRQKNDRATLATQLIAGLQSEVPPTQTLDFASQSFTPAELIAQLERLQSLRAGVNAARAALAERLSEEEAQMPALLATMKGLVALLRVRFGGSPATLLKFGLSEPKVHPPSVKTLAAAAIKREATRQARGTKGSRQRKALKGNVVGVEMTPVVAGPPTSAAPVVHTPSAAQAVVPERPAER